MGTKARRSLGALALAGALLVGSATMASADWSGPYSTLKACEKARQTAAANGWIVGSCQKTKPIGSGYIFYMER